MPCYSQSSRQARLRCSVDPSNCPEPGSDECIPVQHAVREDDWRLVECVDEELTGASNSEGGGKAGFPSHLIMIRSKIEWLGRWIVNPYSELTHVRGRVSNVEATPPRHLLSRKFVNQVTGTTSWSLQMLSQHTDHVRYRSPLWHVPICLRPKEVRRLFRRRVRTGTNRLEKAQPALKIKDILTSNDGPTNCDAWHAAMLSIFC
ncbi:hypothetical protein KC325_g62 [Hortaea werneckii]|nr:hypothetical protein KC325_g62 [Hortaea werneckii]